MKTLVVAVVLLSCSIAFADGPYIVSDPQPEASKFRMKLGSGDWVEAAPVNQGAQFSLSGVAVGTYQGEMQAGFVEYEVTDDATGIITTSAEQWSSSAKFRLKKNPGLSAPMSLHLKSE